MFYICLYCFELRLSVFFRRKLSIFSILTVFLNLPVYTNISAANILIPPLVCSAVYYAALYTNINSQTYLSAFVAKRGHFVTAYHPVTVDLCLCSFRWTTSRAIQGILWSARSRCGQYFSYISVFTHSFVRSFVHVNAEHLWSARLEASHGELERFQVLIRQRRFLYLKLERWINSNSGFNKKKQSIKKHYSSKLCWHEEYEIELLSCDCLWSVSVSCLCGCLWLWCEEVETLSLWLSFHRMKSGCNISWVRRLTSTVLLSIQLRSNWLTRHPSIRSDHAVVHDMQSRMSDSLLLLYYSVALTAHLHNGFRKTTTARVVKFRLWNIK